MLADDPLFGRFCFGGDWRTSGAMTEVTPKDGVRRRFHALLRDRRLHATLASDNFARGRPIVVNDALTELRFEVESDHGGAHATRLSLGGAVDGASTAVTVEVHRA